MRINIFKEKKHREREASSVTRFGEFSQFGEIFHVFGNVLRLYFALGTIFNLPWQILNDTGQIFLVTNG